MSGGFAGCGVVVGVLPVGRKEGVAEKGGDLSWSVSQSTIGGVVVSPGPLSWSLGLFWL